MQSFDFPQNEGQIGLCIAKVWRWDAMTLDNDKFVNLHSTSVKGDERLRSIVSLTKSLAN